MTPIRPSQPDFPDSAALLRFVSGQSPLSEAEAIRLWLAADPTRQASVDETREAWSTTPTAVPAWDRAGVWAKLSTELAGAAPEPPEPVDLPTRKFAAHRALAPRRWASTIARAAAVLLIAGGAAALVARPWSAEPAAMRDIVTRSGQRTVVDLEDGSRVTLDAGSRLRVAADLGAPAPRFRFWRAAEPRRLELVGRAFFDVKHDDHRPFVVETATATTQDVGTSFVIVAYPEASQTQVAVVEGSVALWDRSPSSAPATSESRAGRTSPPVMLLARGDVGTLDARGTATRRRGVAMDAHLSWMRGVLTFEQAPLRDVVAELNRWYDLDIRLADSALGERRLTAQIRTETAEQALHRIGLVLEVKVERRGRTVVLSPNAAAERRVVAR